MHKIWHLQTRCDSLRQRSKPFWQRRNDPGRVRKKEAYASGE